MKIEKVNDHQIRCTLTKADLADRELKISELAYGTEKAKNLFRDMMQQASFEFGFEAEDIPLMIEAIPLNAECIVLIITKVEDPEELDTRFSKFAPSVHDNDDLYNGLDAQAESGNGADDILDLFKKIHDGHMSDADVEDSDTLTDTDVPSPVSAIDTSTAEVSHSDISRLYTFHSLNMAARAAKVLVRFYKGKNSLYKDQGKGIYTLVVTKSDHSPEEFNKICNMLSEYGTQEGTMAASEAFLNEHFEPIVRDSAIQSLSKIL